MTGMQERMRLVLCLFTSAFLGLVSLILPVFILSVKRYDAPLFPLIRSGVEGMSKLSLLFLFISGVFLGMMCPKRPFLVGICTMAAFPLAAVAEMMVDNKSHNLFPIEFFFYGIESLLAVLGAYIGSIICKKIDKRPDAR